MAQDTIKKINRRVDKTTKENREKATAVSNGNGDNTARAADNRERAEDKSITTASLATGETSGEGEEEGPQNE